MWSPGRSSVGSGNADLDVLVSSLPVVLSILSSQSCLLSGPTWMSYFCVVGASYRVVSRLPDLPSGTLRTGV